MSLLSIHRDVRLLIFEFATAEPLKLYPRQVTNGSNKFTWGKVTGDQQADGTWFYKPEGEALTVVQLMRTCKEFYANLSACPVFYRVNTFVFNNPDEIHKFLAALTPVRRHMIRDIDICITEHVCSMKWARTDLGNKLVRSPFNHIFTLLQDCRDLRHITLCKDGSLDIEFDLIIRQSQSTIAPSARSLWNLPGFDVGILSHRTELTDPHSTQTLSQYAAARRLLPSIANASLNWKLYQADAAFENFRAQRRLFRLQNEPTYPTEAQIYRAVRAAGLDFSGDVRIMQQRASGLRDTISHRTRGQLREESNVTEVGTIVKAATKYDVEGMLIWPCDVVIEIRWSTGDPEEGAIECYVRYGKAYEGLWFAWEDVHHLATWDHLAKIRNYYYKLHSCGTSKPHEQLERIMSAPEMKDIMRAVDGLVVGDKPRRWDTAWDFYENQRQGHVQALEALKKERDEKAAARAKARKLRAKELRAQKQGAQKQRARKGKKKNMVEPDPEEPDPEEEVEDGPDEDGPDEDSSD